MTVHWRFANSPADHMDPVSILHTLFILGYAINEQYELFQKVQGARRRSLWRYKLVNEALRDDLTLYKALFETLLYQGNGETLNKLLDTDNGATAFENFKQTLEKTDGLLRELNKVVADKEPRSPAPTTAGAVLMASVVQGNAMQTDIDFIADCADQLKHAQESITRAFKFFHTLYLFHDAPASISMPHSSPNVHGYLRALDAVTSSFYRRPFGVRATGEGAVSTNLLCRLNKHQEAAEKHAKGMAEIGRAWIKDQLMEGESVHRLGLMQTRLMELLWSSSVEQLKVETTEQYTAGDTGKADILDEVRALEEILKHSITRAKIQKFSIAFGGMVKAGKSLFLNSLMGRTILPSDELPSTAWPCRLRHSKGQTMPKLEFDPSPFREGLKKLQERRYGHEMLTYKPPKDDPFESIFAEPESGGATNGSNGNSASNGIDLAVIFQSWGDLHQNTRQNLLKFEDSEFELRTQAEGEEYVRQLLSELNDIVRLCHRFRLGFKMEGVEWPLLTVEFDSFRDQEIEGIFEFIDLPGLGEGFEDFDFEDLIRRVAKETHTIVPIINFKEIPKEDWKRLPKIISSGIDVRTDLVICTHFDQISAENLPEQCINVAKVFWPTSPGSTDRILPVSSLMGLSAYTLLRKSQRVMPSLASFWDPKKIEYRCAEKILGIGNTGTNYKLFDLEMWKKAIKKELLLSGLPDVRKRLSTDMVAKARQRLLILEGHQLWKHVYKIMNSQKRILLEMRRSVADLEQAEHEYQLARRKFVDALRTWEKEEAKRDQSYKEKLRRSLAVLTTLGTEAVTNALDKAIAELEAATPRSNSPLSRLPPEHDYPSLTPNLNSRPANSTTALNQYDALKTASDTTDKSFAERQEGPNIVIVDSKAAAEVFFHNSQLKLAHSLAGLRRQFVTTIRKLADQARLERFESLKKEIKSLDEAAQPQLQEEILIDLDANSFSVQSLAFRKIKKGIKTSNKKYGPKAVWRSMNAFLAHPLIKLRDDYDSDEEDKHKAVEELGFMLRAPIALIAAVPFVLGVMVWPMLTQSTRYHLSPEEIGKRYAERIVQPFLNDLITEGEKTLHQTMKKSAEVAKDAVESALQREDDRYTKERAEKHKPPKTKHIAEFVAAQSNFVAAEAALQTLKEHLNRFV